MKMEKLETLNGYRMKPILAMILLVAVLACGCSSSQRVKPSGYAASNLNSTSDQSSNGDFSSLEDEYLEEEVEIWDPLEPVNRLMFGINDALYFWIIKPVTDSYVFVVPKPVRSCTGNFFQNLATPARLANCLLQGKGEVAETELKRFLINSTFGIAGFGDPALDQHNLLPPNAEDLGQTLGTYGLDNGFYLVLPLLGPSTASDATGKVGDMFLNPIYYIDPTEVAIGVSGTKYVNEGSFHVGEYEDFKANAVDPYVAMRNMYIQYRRKQIEE